MERKKKRFRNVKYENKLNQIIQIFGINDDIIVVELFL